MNRHSFHLPPKERKLTMNSSKLATILTICQRALITVAIALMKQTSTRVTLVIMSNRQNGLKKALPEVFQGAFTAHLLCQLLEPRLNV